MWLFAFEALVALALLLFMVWWTMFAGRRKDDEADEADEADDPPP